jgi:hypothetical protein
MIIGTVYTDQGELLKAISTLYLDKGTFDLDPCFHKGNFYKTIGRPKFVGDLRPCFKWCPVMDVTNLPYQLWNLKSAVFDPPYLVGNNIMAKKYGGFKNVKLMYEFFAKAIDNFIRVIAPGGILVVKIQDTSVGGQNYFSHLYIANYATQEGFELLDCFILINKNVMRDKQKSSRIASKEHTFFLVFKRVERKIRNRKF